MLPNMRGVGNRATIHMDHFYVELSPGINRVSREELDAPHLSKRRIEGWDGTTCRSSGCWGCLGGPQARWCHRSGRLETLAQSMQPLPHHRDLATTGCIAERLIVRESCSQRLQPSGNIPRQRHVRRSPQLSLHETLKPLFSALKIAETAVSFKGQGLLQGPDPHQKTLQSLGVQAGSHLEGGVSGWLGHQWV